MTQGLIGLKGQKTKAKSSPVVLASDQDALPITDNAGSITVDGTVGVSGTVTVAAHAVTNAGTFATQAAGDTAHDAVDAGSPLKVGGYAKAAAPADVSADGDRVNAWYLRNGAQASVVTAGGALIGGDAANGLDVDVTRVSGTVTVGDGGGAISVDDNGGSITVDGTFWQATQPVSGTVTASNNTGDAAHDAVDSGNPVKVGGYAKAAAPADVSADGDRVNAWYLRNGAQAAVLTAAGALVGGDAANGLDVDVTRVGGNVTVVQATATNLKVDASGVAVPVTDNGGLLSIDDGAGSITVDGTFWQATQPVSGTVTASNTSGDVAHDGADSGNPTKVGTRAINALPTAVSNNDRANAVSDLWGRQLVSHIDPAMAIHKSFNATTTQTGTDVWSPTSGKKIAVTSVIIGAYGTTAARVILWFGDNADTTYTEGTDQALVKASFAPSATSKPGLVYTPAFPVFCTTADRELHITTDAGISIDVTVEGYEW